MQDRFNLHMGWLAVLLAIWALLLSTGGENMPAWLETASTWIFWIIFAFVALLVIRLWIIGRDKTPSPELRAIKDLTEEIKGLREDRQLFL